MEKQCISSSGLGCTRALDDLDNYSLAKSLRALYLEVLRMRRSLQGF